MWPMLKSVTETLQSPESVLCWPETLSSLSADNDFRDGRTAPLILFPPNERCSRWSRLSRSSKKSSLTRLWPISRNRRLVMGAMCSNSVLVTFVPRKFR